VRRWAEVIAATIAAPRLLPGAAGCLLVVDYAENQADTLADLLAQVVTPVSGDAEVAGRVRVLLLARHDRDWWPRLARDHPDRDWVDPESVRLGGLAGELPADGVEAVWAGAVGAFAAQARRAGVLPAAADPAETARDILGAGARPAAPGTRLDLYAAALLRVLDHAHAGRPVAVSGGTRWPGCSTTRPGWSTALWPRPGWRSRRPSGSRPCSRCSSRRRPAWPTGLPGWAAAPRWRRWTSPRWVSWRWDWAGSTPAL
jgi:hypothetical protein